MAKNTANNWLIGTVSAAVLSAGALWEGTEYYAYKDLAGVPTVCMGYTGKDIVFGRKYTQAECSNYLRKEMVVHGNGVLNCITRPLEQKHFDAFTLMAYNIGVAGFCGSRTAKLYNQGLPLQACDAIAYGPNGQPVWAYAGGKYVQGLNNRRVYERAMCAGIEYVKPSVRYRTTGLPVAGWDGSLPFYGFAASRGTWSREDNSYVYGAIPFSQEGYGFARSENQG